MNKNIASKGFIGSEILDLVTAFPKNGDKFWALLVKRLQAYDCTEQEIINAVDSTIDSINKDLLTVADIIQPILEARTANIVD